MINLLGFRIKLKKQKFSHIHIDDGNVVKIDSSVNKNKLKLNVRGKNNRVIIGNVAIVEELNISIYAVFCDYLPPIEQYYHTIGSFENQQMYKYQPTISED